MKTLRSIVQPSLRLAAATLMLLAAAACSSAPPAPAMPASATPASDAPGADSAALWRQVQAELGDVSCDQAQQCHSIGAGSKACGGPERYLAWSSKHSDGVRLAQLVAQHAAARREEDARNRMMSTCSVVQDPGATCRAGSCVLQLPRPGGLEVRPPEK